MLDCYFKKYYQIDCPGCGMQRAFFSLLEGDIKSSLHHNAALLPLILTFSLLLFQLIFKTKKGGLFIVLAFSLTAFTMFTQLLTKWIF
jgi:hypothetical protein